MPKRKTVLFFSFLNQGGQLVSGKINNAPFFETESQTGYSRLINLLSSWTGETVQSIIDLEFRGAF